MAHPNVALDVERRCPCKPKRLHVGVDQGLVHGIVHSQCPLELGDQLSVHGTPMVVDKLDLFVRPVVCLEVWNSFVKKSNMVSLIICHSHSSH